MVVLWFLAGAAIEVLNTLTRKWSVERLGSPLSVVLLAGGAVLRLVVTSAIVMLGFRYSAGSGAAALVGYLCSRWVMIWWVNCRLSEAKTGGK
jgi:hypothetical protein